MNYEHLAIVRDRIAADLDHFDMGGWIQTTECGTTACIAGFAALAAGQQRKWSGFYDSAVTRSLALSYLGITNQQADKLFFSCWPGRFLPGYGFVLTEASYRGEAMAKNAIALLDALISGEVVLTSDGMWEDYFGDVEA